MVQKEARYPAVARSRGLEGKVVVSFSIKATGELGAVAVASSSGCSVLDENTILAVRRAAPFSGLTREVMLTLPITYRLERGR